MSLKSGTKLGPYEILSLLGAGGMGEVYKAHDTRLDRTVALKTLRAHLADNPGVKDRFEREARTVASLQHDHICVLHDIRKDAPVFQGVPAKDTIDYLVLEYLEGETLATRMLKGPLPLAQVLQYAIEIADALDKAHRKGVTHRDIKPGNVMLVKSGSGYSTKLLDFGLAKLKQVVPQEVPLGPDDPTPPLGVQPRNPTAFGTIMGTYQYMSPEQAEGKNDTLDARSDIFSFGAMLYEMVTGKKAFEGKTQISLVSAILKDDPPAMSKLQPVTPPALDRVVKQCLSKEPDERWQTASDLCRELKWIGEPGAHGSATSPGAGRQKGQPWQTWVAVATLTILVGFAAWKLKDILAGGLRSPAHVTINLLPGDLLAGSSPPVAVSPDGGALVYVAMHDGVQQLLIRSIENGDTKPLSGTEGAIDPFFSPDGKWVGFFANGKLKKIALSGGTPQVLCDSGSDRGATWGPGDTIVFSPSTSSGLMHVPASGGTPQVLTTVDHANGEFSHRWPQFLPGGKALLLTVERGTGWDEMDIEVLRLDSGERRAVLHGGSAGRVIPSGHLVYYREGSLLAVPFDTDRLEVTNGTPVTITEGVKERWTTRAAYYSFSAAGILAYIPANLHQLERRLVWANRNGDSEPLPVSPRDFYEGLNPALSPDGQRIAVEVIASTDEIWIYDLARGSMSQLLSHGNSPLWTPDGKRITYQSVRKGLRNIYWKAADGPGAEEQLTSGEQADFPSSWSPDGKFLSFWRADPVTGNQIWLLSMEGERKPRPFWSRPPRGGQWSAFSPDGKWFAYDSTESGRRETYVEPFPGPGGKWRISDNGGASPVWSRNGRELFYDNGDKKLVVAVSTSPGFTASKPRVLFEGHNGFVVGGDVSPDGQRLLMIQSVEPEQPATQINVVLNWFEELKKKVPTDK